MSAATAAAEQLAYERRIGRWSRAIADRFVEWVGIPHGAGVLDVGAGTGALSAALSARASVSLIVAADNSHDDLQYGRTHSLAGAARFVTATAEALPFRDAAFAAALAGLLINQLPHPLAAVSEMRRVTQSHGVIAAYVWDFAEGMQPLRHFWDAAIAVDPAAAARDQAVKFPLCRREALSALFGEAGLRNVVTTALEAPAMFAGFADFWEPMISGSGSVADYARALPVEQRNQLCAELQRRLPVDGDGSIRLGVRAFAVRGTNSSA